jgi:ABC-type uncharacterized transport system substrate-binding protein
LRQLSAKLLGLLALCWWLPATAAEPVLVVLSEPGGVYAEVAAVVRRALAGTARVVEALPQDAAVRDPPSASIVVAVGTQACRQAAAADTAVPLLCTLVPRIAYERIAVSVRGRVATAVLLDQPVARQFALIHAALPGRRDVAVLLGPESAAMAPALKSAAAARALRLAVIDVPEADALPAALQSAFDQADVLLAVPDTGIYNRGTVQHILRSAFENRVALVAFSPSYVRAGALLGVYSTPLQAGAQAARWIARYLEGRALPAAQPAGAFEIGVNQNVARVLGIPLDDERGLAERVRRLEQPR